MRGIMFRARGVTEIVDEPEPTCGDHQILLRTLYSAVSNGTERSFLMGGPYGGKKWPNRIGYLAVSEIVETGRDVTRFQTGQVVYTGTSPGHVAYHTADEDDLIAPVPVDLDRRAATMLGLAGVSAFNARRVQVSAADRVLVTGAGGIGLTALQVARAAGACVTLVSRTQSRRELGMRLGADDAFDPDAEPKRLFEAGPHQVLLECAGADLDALIQPGQALLDRFARVALIAGRARVEYNFLWASLLRLSLHQSTHFDQPALDAVVAQAAAGTLNLEALVQDVVPVAEAVQVYDELRDDPMARGGTVFDWS